MTNKPMTALEQMLRDGRVILLDGATGTELQHRGAPMHDAVWCAAATLSHGDVLRGIHEDYIRAGAHVITANTFASNRNMLEPAGMGDRVAEINRRAVEIALEARNRAAADHPVAVAGSMSHMVPMVSDSDHRDPDRVPDTDRAADNSRELAGLLAEGGVDLIIMEMMSDPALAVPAVQAAAETGLPVWVGYSGRGTDGGEVAAYARTEMAFTEAVRQILPAGGVVAGIMHSNINVTGPALDILREHWSGPLMAYPDSGYFKMPDWQFADIIPPDEFAAQATAWVDSGVQIVGGCCGLGLEHIRSLKAELPERAGGAPGT